VKKVAKIGTFAPHELAPHLGVLFHVLPQGHLGPVKIALEQAINLLRIVTQTDIDLKNPDHGIPFAIGMEWNHPDDKVKAAARLLRICLHAVENGKLPERSRPALLLNLAAMSGYVADQQRKNASKPRLKRSAEDALDRGIRDVLKGNLELTWKQTADQLEGVGVVVVWDDAKLTFTNGKADGEKTISAGGYRRRFGKIKNALTQRPFNA
jgi:hypothetical protein